MFNEPLGLPQGSVRAIVTLTVLAASVVLHVINQPSAELDALAVLAVGLYFGVRTSRTSVPLPPAPPPVEPVEATVIQPGTPDEGPDTTGFVAGEK